MIKTKKDLKYYLEQDKKSLGIKRKKPKLFSDDVWKFEIALRHREYYMNSQEGIKIVKKIKYYYWTLKYHHYSVKYGFYIPANVCREGLQINHTGLLVINDNARIGKNLDIHQGVNIGINIDPNKAPRIGDNVFIGPGAKIFGDIEIADNIAIAAGSVVNKSFTTPNVTIGGVPARVINSSKGNPYIKESLE
ncbi:MAG TPA: serine acetyltransferase [Eubacterium sp.]|nr:serine acetyltransferase [Eubacterium sp.]